MFCTFWWRNSHSCKFCLNAWFLFKTFLSISMPWGVHLNFCSKVVQQKQNLEKHNWRRMYKKLFFEFWLFLLNIYMSHHRRKLASWCFDSHAMHREQIRLTHSFMVWFLWAVINTNIWLCWTVVNTVLSMVWA